MNRNAIAVLTIAAVSLLSTGCGSDSDSKAQPDRETLIAAISENGSSSADSECVADSMLSAGITTGQLGEMTDWDGSGSTPAGIEMYREARDACGGSIDDVMTSISDEVDNG